MAGMIAGTMAGMIAGTMAGGPMAGMIGETMGGMIEGTIADMIGGTIGGMIGETTGVMTKEIKETTRAAGYNNAEIFSCAQVFPHDGLRFLYPILSHSLSQFSRTLSL